MIVPLQQFAWIALRKDLRMHAKTPVEMVRDSAPMRRFLTFPTSLENDANHPYSLGLRLPRHRCRPSQSPARQSNPTTMISLFRQGEDWCAASASNGWWCKDRRLTNMLPSSHHSTDRALLNFAQRLCTLPCSVSSDAWHL